MKDAHYPRRFNAERRKRESGQALAIVAITLVVLILAAGLAIDMGYLRYQKRLLQMAADSAAIAGAANLTAGGANINCQDAGCLSGEGGINSWYNGFNPSSAGTHITLSSPPNDGQYAGTNGYVEANINQAVPTFFVKILGSSFSSFVVSARAVAYPGPGPSCVYALGSGSPPQGGVQLTGLNTDFESTTCVVTDNGNLCVPEDSYFFDTLGSIYAGSYTSCSSAIFVDPTPVQGAAAGNPLEYLSNNTPSVGGGGSPCGAYTYCAGSYPSGITIVGTGQTVTFQPGTYVLGGNGLSISGSGQVTGSGVTFYTNGTGAFSINQNDDYGDACKTNPTTTIGMTVQLTAPTTSPYAGILLIQDDSQPSTAPASTITLPNGDTCNTQVPTTLTTSSYLWGVMYLPSTSLTLNGTGLDSDNGCSTIPRFTIVVAYALTLEGNVNMGVSDCPTGGTSTAYFGPSQPPLPDPIKDAVLVE